VRASHVGLRIMSYVVLPFPPVAQAVGPSGPFRLAGPPVIGLTRPRRRHRLLPYPRPGGLCEIGTQVRFKGTVLEVTSRSGTRPGLLDSAAAPLELLGRRRRRQGSCDKGYGHAEQQGGCFPRDQSDAGGRRAAALTGEAACCYVDVREPNDVAIERYPMPWWCRCRFDQTPFRIRQGPEVFFACASGGRSVTASSRPRIAASLCGGISPAASWPEGCRLADPRP